MAMNLDSGPKICDQGSGFVLHTVSKFRTWMILVVWKYSWQVNSDFTLLDKESVKESNFSNFTYWFNPMFLSNNSKLKWCNQYINSKVNSFEKNSFWQKNLEKLT